MEKIQVLRKGRLESALRTIFMGGTAVSMALLLLGLALLIPNNESLVISSPQQALRAVLQLQPAGFVNLGIFTLLVTPMTGVIAVMINLLFQRDWLYAGITLTVVVLLVVSVFIGGH